MTIREFDRIVMGVRGLLVDLSENRCRVPQALRPPEEAAVCDEKSIGKTDLGSRQKANRLPDFLVQRSPAFRSRNYA